METRDEQSIFVPPTLVPGLSHLGGLGLGKSSFNPFGQNHYNSKLSSKPPVLGAKVFSPSSSPVPPREPEKQLLPPSSFNPPTWQTKSTPPPQSSPGLNTGYPSWNSTPPPPPVAQPSNGNGNGSISKILASLEQWDIRLTDEQLEKIPGVKREKSPTDHNGDSSSPIFQLDNPVQSPTETLFPSHSFLPPMSSDEVPNGSSAAVFPSAHDFQLPKTSPMTGGSFPSPIGRKKASWDSNMAPIPMPNDRPSPGTPPAAPIGSAIKSIGKTSGQNVNKWDSPPIRGHSPIGMPIGGGVHRQTKSKSIDSTGSHSWGMEHSTFSPGIIGPPHNGANGSIGRSILGLDSFDLDFSSNGGDHPGHDGYLLKHDSIPTGLDPEFKRKVEDLLRNDHDDELDLLPDILQTKNDEFEKTRYVEKYGASIGTWLKCKKNLDPVNSFGS